jgi:mycothiol S-conjugate amidase
MAVPADRDLCLLTLHAHPDDESSKGASTVAKYHDEGVRTVLVCCTGGELGDIANPAVDTPEVRENLAEIRKQELAAATSIIGFDKVVMLGYRDSGMPGSPGNDDPRSFHRADFDEAVGRLVAIIRAERPQVIMTYGDDQQGYPHPDHLRVHDISIPAFERAGDADWYPDAGEPWQPLKLYYSTWSRARARAIHDRFVALGMESPYDDKWFNRPWQDHRITTRIDILDHYEIRNQALIAHATQIDPTSHWWFGLPDSEARTVHPYEDYILARSLVDHIPGEDPASKPDPEAAPVIREHDLFEGIRVTSDAAAP